jgi:hypothetical protein
MAMNSAVLLAEENRQLRIENQRQKKKRAKKRSYIATGSVLIVQKGLDLLQIANEGLEGRVANEEAIVRTRVLCTYSMCKSLSHTTCIYSTKVVSN